MLTCIRVTFSGNTNIWFTVGWVVMMVLYVIEQCFRLFYCFLNKCVNDGLHAFSHLVGPPYTRCAGVQGVYQLMVMASPVGRPGLETKKKSTYFIFVL